MRPHRWTLAIAALLALTALTHAQTTNLNTTNSTAGPAERGTLAFQANNYAEAVTDFQEALTNDPNSRLARFSLGMAYAYQVKQGDHTAANLALADNAIASFKLLPEDDPAHVTILKEVAFLYRITARLNEARNAELALLEVTPDDPVAHYTLGLLDYIDAWNFTVDTFTDAKLKDDGLGNASIPPATCAELKAHNANTVDDAITHLSTAVTLNPLYADAMSYLQLAYRRRADIDCNNPAARAADIALADKWAKAADETKAQVTTPAK